MKVGYFDCGSGASGDMVLGALVGAGADLNELNRQIHDLLEGRVRLSASQVSRAHFPATKVDVQCNEAGLGERHLGTILKMIQASALPLPVQRDSERVFRRLAEAEAAVHGCSVEEVHFHEVGALDSIADIVGSVAGIHQLGIEHIYVSPLALGSGYVNCRHGRLPVPAPATAQLVRGWPVMPGTVEGELLTPTGAALLTTLAQPGAAPAFTNTALGCGAGGRDRDELPNILRLFVGETQDPILSDFVWVLETNIDDMPAELGGYLFERLLEAGALDVYATPVLMKKGRQGMLITVLCEEPTRGALERIIFQESTTFGIRRQRMERSKLAREWRTVATSAGPIRVKVGLLDGRICTAAPEYEDCRQAAAAAKVPLKAVYAEALRAFEKG